jgi:myo-inositol-1(or 4)-monophosphatase
MEPTRELVENIAREAGDSIFALFGKTGIKSTKANLGDVLTEADLLATNLIRERIAASFPSHNIISEEEGDDKKSSAWKWIVDPLDGTRNFACGIPLWGVLVGVAYENTMQFAAVYIPTSNELISAEKGKGAFRDGKKVHCSTTIEWDYSTGCSTTSLSEKKYALILNLLNETKTHPLHITCTGSGAVNCSYVSTGKRDWWFAKEGGAWDYAAPSLIAKEAGCIVTRIDGSEWKLGDREILASTPALHDRVVRMLNSS